MYTHICLSESSRLTVVEDRVQHHGRAGTCDLEIVTAPNLESTEKVENCIDNTNRSMLIQIVVVVGIGIIVVVVMATIANDSNHKGTYRNIYIHMYLTARHLEGPSFVTPQNPQTKLPKDPKR